MFFQSKFRVTVKLCTGSMRSPGGGSSFAIDEPVTNRKKVSKISCQAKVRVYKLHLEVYGHSENKKGLDSGAGKKATEKQSNSRQRYLQMVHLYCIILPSK